MRLIDADALRKEHCDGCSADIQEECKTDPVCASLMWVHDAPTIDAVPVVRCAECKHNNESRAIGDSNMWCDYWGIDPDTDDFCSYGERREDGENDG